ncbi:MAG TPA: acyl-CoA dehydrogenase family protein [Longimicrobiaceae bacterium]|nr:acyl-CoA dehydrogenase family protein [Longimicrobiaceae bacterium]
MEPSSSPKLREMVARAREITESVVAPNAEAEDREARWPAPAMRALGDAGLLGLNVPEALGGHGEGLAGLVAVAETLARGSASTAMCFAMHCVGTAVVAAKATEHQKEAYLVPIARGEHVTTLALSEPGTGAHFYLPQSLVVPEGECYRVRGTKSFVTNGGEADSYVVSVAAAEGAAAGEGTFSCVLVDSGSPGLHWEDPWNGLGMRANSSRTVRLEDVPVPRRNLLGEEGDQLWYVFEVVAPYFLMAMAGTYLGVAAAAFETAREHLGTRRYAHTGELLGSAPVLAHRLGELWTEVARTRHLVYAAAARADAGDPAALTGVLASKAAAGDTAVLVANEAMTLCGGAGYRENGTLARLLRDARASHVMAPTTDILKTWVGRALLGQPLL